jgi:MoxR-like ATPase
VQYNTNNLLSHDADTPAKKKPANRLITRKLPKILTLAVLNALTPNSAELLVGGHGGGKTSLVKYLGRMFTGKSLSEIEEVIVRAHPQLTEEKLIATLNVSKLMKGEEQVIWRTFATSFWKIVDEINRCSPYTQNILLSLLAEGKIKYYDSVLNVSKYCLYATLNPHDAGTFAMSGPFLDRFGISVPISMPKSQDLAVILGSKDEKLGGYDELVQVPQVLTEEELLSIWYDVESITCSLDAENFIHAIIREFTSCIRLDKGNSDYLKPSNGLCNGCHFNVPDSIPCSNVDDILSVRVAKDFLRYSKALSWLLGLKEVTLNTVEVLAPYIISHRVNYLERKLNRSPYWGDKYAFTQKIIDIVRKRYQTRKIAYDMIQKFREGKGKSTELDKLKLMAKNDLIVKLDLLPLAKSLFTAKYQKEVSRIQEAVQTQDVETISKMRQDLLQNMDFPNRGELIYQLTESMKILTLNSFNCSLELWDSIRITIDGMFPQFSKKLLETTKQRGTYRLRTQDIELDINITGIKPHDVVNFSFFGGKSALDLKNTLEERFQHSFKSMEDLLQESKAAQEKADEEFHLLTKDLNLSVKNIKNPIISDEDELFDDELLNKDD